MHCSQCIYRICCKCKKRVGEHQGTFNISEWKAPISPNFQKISRILEGSYLSEFQNEGGSNRSEFWTFMLKVLSYIKNLNFRIVFYLKIGVKKPFTSILGMYFFFFLRGNMHFYIETRTKIDKTS